MKTLYLLTTLSLLTISGYAQKRSKSEMAFISSLENIDNEELWLMRERSQNKFQRNLISGAVITGWGLGSLAAGGILMLTEKPELNDSGKVFLGAGFFITIIGTIFNGAAGSHRKRDLWIQKELWIREEASLSISPGGVRLTFGR